LPIEFTSMNLDSGRYFYGMATLPTVDEEGDKISMKAIQEGSETLTTSPYNKIFLGHNYQDIAVGLIIAKAVTKKGLLILAKLNDAHERADEVWKSLNEGYLDGLSIGGSFLSVERVFDKELNKYINIVKKVRFREVSLTSIPAHSQALMVGAFTKASKIINEIVKVNDVNETENIKYSVTVHKDMAEQETEIIQPNSEQVEVTADAKTEDKPAEAEVPVEKETPVEKEDKPETVEQVEEPKAEEPKAEEPKAEEVKEEIKPKKVDTPLLDALRKQIEELKTKILELEKQNEQMTDKKIIKSVRQSVPSNSIKEIKTDKTVLLDALRR
jgi:HK97 family phage prohead protease